MLTKPIIKWIPKLRILLEALIYAEVVPLKGCNSKTGVFVDANGP